MKKFICRLLSAFLATATVLSLGVTAFAVESSEENEDVTIVQVLVVSDNGCYLYEGEDAQAAFLEIKDGSFVASSLNEIDSFPVVTDAAKVLPVLNEPGIAPNIDSCQAKIIRKKSMARIPLFRTPGEMRQVQCRSQQLPLPQRHLVLWIVA